MTRTLDTTLDSGRDRTLTRRDVIAYAAGLSLAPVALAVAKAFGCDTLLAPRVALAEPAERGAAETEALAAAQKEYDEARSQLEQIGRKLEQTQYDLSETTNQLNELGKDIAQTQTDIDATTTDLDTAQNALAAYLVIGYKSGAVSTLDLLLQSADFNDFVTRSFYVGRIQDSQVDAIEDIKDLKVKLEQQEQTLTTQQDQQAELQASLEAQQAELQTQQEESNKVVTGLSEQVKQLFAAQQTELQAAAAARQKAADASAAGQANGVPTPGKSMGSVVENAYACMGIPYVWGGDDSNYATYAGYDCSGFTQHCYALEGYEIGRTTWYQIDDINALGNWRDNVDDLQPGDLVFPHDGHVGIYIGNHQMIDAPYPGMFIQIDPVEEFLGGGSPV